jgi:hypothetical protein
VEKFPFIIPEPTPKIADKHPPFGSIELKHKLHLVPVLGVCPGIIKSYTAPSEHETVARLGGKVSPAVTVGSLGRGDLELGLHISGNTDMAQPVGTAVLPQFLGCIDHIHQVLSPDSLLDQQ